jgi:hypothetical protein
MSEPCAISAVSNKPRQVAIRSDKICFARQAYRPQIDN